MQKIKKMPLIAIVIMTILSFANLFGLKIAGITVIVGVIFFFIDKAAEKQPFECSGLDIGAIKTNFKDKKFGSGLRCQSSWTLSA